MEPIGSIPHLPLGRPRRRWEDNIRMNLEEIGINAGKGPFINYVRVRREGGGLEKSPHTLTLGKGSNPFLRTIYIRSGLAGIIFHLRLEGKKKY